MTALLNRLPPGWHVRFAVAKQWLSESLRPWRRTRLTEESL